MGREVLERIAIHKSFLHRTLLLKVKGVVLKNMTQMNLCTKEKQTHRFRELIYDYHGRKVGGRGR